MTLSKEEFKTLVMLYATYDADNNYTVMEEQMVGVMRRVQE